MIVYDSGKVGFYMKRKIFALLSLVISVIFVFQLVGCGKRAESTTTPTAASSDTEGTYSTEQTTSTTVTTKAPKTTSTTAKTTKKTTAAPQTTEMITREPGTILPVEALSEKDVAAHKYIDLWRTAEVPYNNNILKPMTPAIVPYVVEGSDRAVIIFPGGGYFQVSMTGEGTDIAEAYNKQGISAFVVYYRANSNKVYNKEAMLADAQRAVQTVRYYADSFGIDKNKIAVCGFSAGGHLALMLGTHTPTENLGYDVIGEESSIPNAMILGYPVTTLGDGTYYTMPENFLGKDYKNQDEIKKYSYETCVENAPPAYIFYSVRDSMVNYTKNSVALANAMKEAGKKVEISEFSDGGHGVGLGSYHAEFSTWLKKSVDFLDEIFG